MDPMLQHNDELVKKQNEKGLKINQFREKLISENITFEEVVECPTGKDITCFKFHVANYYLYLSLLANDEWYLGDKERYVFICSHNDAIHDIDWNHQFDLFVKYTEFVE